MDIPVLTHRLPRLVLSLNITHVIKVIYSVQDEISIEDEFDWSFSDQAQSVFGLFPTTNVTCKCGLHPGSLIQTSVDEIAGCSWRDLASYVLVWKSSSKLGMRGMNCWRWDPNQIN